MLIDAILCSGSHLFVFLHGASFFESCFCILANNSFTPPPNHLIRATPTVVLSIDRAWLICPYWNLYSTLNESQYPVSGAGATGAKPLVGPRVVNKRRLDLPQLASDSMRRTFH